MGRLWLMKLAMVCMRRVEPRATAQMGICLLIGGGSDGG